MNWAARTLIIIWVNCRIIDCSCFSSLSNRSMKSWGSLELQQLRPRPEGSWLVYHLPLRCRIDPPKGSLEAGEWESPLPGTCHAAGPILTSWKLKPVLGSTLALIFHMIWIFFSCIAETIAVASCHFSNEHDHYIQGSLLVTLSFSEAVGNSASVLIKKTQQT